MTEQAAEARDFLTWVAEWLDRMDPILSGVFANSRVLTDEEKQRIAEWLAGDEVQTRLRSLADTVDALRSERDYFASRARLRELEQLAKNARALAASPDYDRDAMRNVLRAILDAALASEEKP